jgi:teichuronic acid biosynthesis glycosyltransferase TuaC
MPVHRQYVRAASKLISPRPDIIHAHFSYPGGIAGIRLSHLWKMPVVLTLHGDDVNVHPIQYPRLHRALLSSVTQANTVIAVSEALAERTASLTGRRPEVAPIGINLQLFAPTCSQQEARCALGLPREGWIVLHLGRLVEEKGIRNLLTAMSALRESKCHGLFVGLGPLAATVRATPGCSVVGVQPNERVPLFLRAADVFVLPSYSEGMPTVLVEAGAAGLPVIATAVGGIPELLHDERGWVVPPKDTVALGEAMRTVLRHPAEAARRAERLRKYVQDHYDVRTNAERLMSAYRNCITNFERLTPVSPA